VLVILAEEARSALRKLRAAKHTRLLRAKRAAAVPQAQAALGPLFEMAAKHAGWVPPAGPLKPVEAGGK